MNHLDEFKARVEAFLIERRLSAREFGHRACKDASFVFDLRDGREPRSSTMSKVDRWMQEQLIAAGQIPCDGVPTAESRP